MTSTSTLTSLSELAFEMEETEFKLFPMILQNKRENPTIKKRFPI